MPKAYPYVKNIPDSETVIIEFGPDRRERLSYAKAYDLYGLLGMILPGPSIKSSPLTDEEKDLIADDYCRVCGEEYLFDGLCLEGCEGSKKK